MTIVRIALAEIAIKSLLLQMGLVAVGNSSPDFAAQIAKESDKWSKVIAARHIVIN